MAPQRDQNDATGLALVLQRFAWTALRIRPARVGLTPLPDSQIAVAMALLDRPGRSLGAIAAELRMRPNNVSTIVRAMTAKGLLRREPSAADSRVTLLYPSDALRANRDKLILSWVASLSEALERLPESDRQAIAAAQSALAKLTTEFHRAEAGQSPPDALES